MAHQCVRLKRFNPLSAGIKLQILLSCHYTFLTEVVGEALKISRKVNLSDHVVSSRDLSNY